MNWLIAMYVLGGFAFVHSGVNNRVAWPIGAVTTLIWPALLVASILVDVGYSIGKAFR